MQDFEAHQRRRLEQYDEIVRAARVLYDVRNREYRDSARTLGVIGVLYEMNGIGGRLRALRDDLLRLHFAEGADDEEVQRVYRQLHDKLRDAINYAVMATQLLEDENILGNG
jgi:hypothetical protein